MKLLVLVLVSVVLAGCTKLVSQPVVESTPSVLPVTNQAPQELPQSAPEQPSQSTPTFGTQTKSAHFVSSSPTHGAILSQPPAVVEFTFNFDIDPSSTVSVTSNGEEFADGKPIVGANRLTLTQGLRPLEDGDYTVSYNACWPDQTCHPGQFEFAIRTE